MALIVTGVGSLIHLYSIGYMKDDASYARYFSYLNLFLFFMLLLVLGRSLLVVFIGWEGVGLASYLLIGFWFEDLDKARAGKKAFITNRIGDVGFLLGMFLLFAPLGTLDMDRIDAAFGGAHAARGVGEPGGHPAVHRRNGQVGADSALRLAAGRHGRPDARLGAHPCRDHGDRRRLPGGAHVRHLHAGARGQRGHRRDRRAHRLLCGDDRFRPDRHQEGARLLDDLAARLHVRGTRGRRLQRGDLPPLHPRLLQGLPVPRRGQRDPRPRRRAGSAQDGRSRTPDSRDLRDLRRGHRRHRRHPAAGRVLLQGRDPLVRLRQQPRRLAAALRRGRDDRAADRVLHVPAAVAHFFRSLADESGNRAPRARIAAIDDRGADRAGRAFGDRRLPGAAAVSRAAAAAARDGARARALRDAAWSSLSIALALAGLAAAAIVYGGDGARGRGPAPPFPGAAPRPFRQVLCRRGLRPVAGTAAVLDLRSRVFPARRPKNPRRLAARPRCARAAHCRPA